MTTSLTRTVRNKHLGFFRFRQLKGAYLLTSDTGKYSFLSTNEFADLLEGRLTNLSSDTRSRLQERGFFTDAANLGDLVQQYSSRHAFLSKGTDLHIIVVTLRCNHRCIYCQTNSGNATDRSLDMDLKTAKSVVEGIFESPSNSITIEFQGGEPTLNFEAIRFIVEYALKKNKTEKKNLQFTLVSNLTSLTQGQFDYIINKKIGVCTSLDGPCELQNKHRVFLVGAGSYHKTLHWLKRFKKSFGSKEFPHRTNALTTITRFSLPYHKVIVDEYIRLGLTKIHLRPASPFGHAKTNWKKIGFSVDEFLSFYRKSMDYIVELNRSGKTLVERTALIFLKKILTDTDPNYLDLRSPCGAGIGQLAYHFNGDIYSCDEGRMLGQMGDPMFKLGHVLTHGYQDIMEAPALKAVCVASCLDNLPGCHDCAYMPYCGVCPIYNYTQTSSVFGKEPHNDRCRINSGILDYLFEKLAEEKNAKVLQTWIQNEQGAL